MTDTIPCATDAASLCAAAWAAANLHANALDRNSQHSVALLLARNAFAPLPEGQMAKLLAYGAWWEACWLHYAEVIARIDAGEVASFSPDQLGDCPVTIWQIAAAGQA